MNQFVPQCNGRVGRLAQPTLPPCAAVLEKCPEVQDRIVKVDFQTTFHI